MKYDFDCIIVGAGIAGITAAIYLKRANVNICLLDSSAPGGLLNKLKKVKNYPGFPEITGPDLAYNLFEQLNDLEIKTRYGKVLKVENHEVTTDKETLTANKIIIATGRPSKRLKDTENLENVSYCAICDGSLYKEKNVALIGENMESIDDAIYLAGICNKVLFIYNGISQDDINEKISKFRNIILKEKCEYKIDKKDSLANAILISEEIFPIDGIFVNLGHEPKSDFISGIKLENGYIVVDKNMQSSNENIYACGDIIAKDIYQLTTAAAEGTIAAINVKKCISQNG